MTIEAVREAVKNGAEQALGARVLKDVQVERDVDNDGREILRVTLVVPDGTIEHLGSGRLLQANTTIKDAIRKAGEERWSVLYYATPEELEDDGDTKS